MMQRYQGSNTWNTISQGNTLFADSVKPWALTADQGSWTDLRWEQMTAEQLKSQLRSRGEQHVVYLGAPLRIREWTQELRDKMLPWSHCAATEYNLEVDAYRELMAA